MAVFTTNFRKFSLPQKSLRNFVLKKWPREYFCEKADIRGKLTWHITLKLGEKRKVETGELQRDVVHLC
jgi:hypothetical protein